MGSDDCYPWPLLTLQKFQFTLPCGERLLKNYIPLKVFLFQFTLPCGERLWLICLFYLILFISIHAPVWGATLDTYLYFFHRNDFNSRSRVGSDKRQLKRNWKTIYFNSRSRVGSDTQVSRKKSSTWNFNSRSRVGSDILKLLLLVSVIEFQFTLPCGERLTTIAWWSGFLSISIHAPVWGATGLIFSTKHS